MSAEPPTYFDVITDHFASRYDVDTATSATRAVEISEHYRPDVVFLDIKGLTLLKFLLCSKVVLKARR